MTVGPWKLVGFAALFFAAEQPTAPAEPRFEVVSIHPIAPNEPPLVRDQNFTPILPGGQYADSRAGLLFMITFYDVKNPSTQLIGLPNWARNQTFSVSAKPPQGFPTLPPDENREQVRLMMRTMLTDRFHLRLHNNFLGGGVSAERPARCAGVPGHRRADARTERARLAERTGARRLPVIFITGHGDVPTSVRAMKAGATEFLTKPFCEQEFLQAVNEALQRDRESRKRRARLAELQYRYQSLTPRE